MGYGRGDRNNPLRHELGDKPKREVLPTDEVVHKWAHAAQSRGRNAHGNLFFIGPVIYSYRTSWPLACIYHNKRGDMVLLNADKYSVTTAQHQSAVNRAVSHMQSVAVPEPIIDEIGGTLPLAKSAQMERHDSNIKYLVDKAAGALATAQRAMQVSTVQYRREEAASALEDAARYMAFFGIRRKPPVFPTAEWDAALERVQRIESPDPVRDAKRYAEKKKREDKMRTALQSEFDRYVAAVTAYNARIDAEMAKLPDAAEHWRATGQWPENSISSSGHPWIDYKVQKQLRRAGFELPRTSDTRAGRHNHEVLLRVDGEQIITSLGARVPLAAAPMVWNHVQLARKCGGIDTRSDTSGLRRLSVIRIGDYPLDRIDANGDLHAGCHHIKFSELELLARKLGLTEEVQS